MVTGIPVSGSWQDLKDHFREAGDVAFAGKLFIHIFIIYIAKNSI
jgi:hypothetical protein